MKDYLNYLALLIIGITFGFVIYGTYQAHTPNYHMTTINPYQTEVIILPVYVEKETEAAEEPVLEEEGYLNLTFEEQDLLEQIAYAEARGEGVRGMMLVMNVVINRSKKTGCSIHDVIYAPNQFYTAGMTPDVSEECHEALALVMDGVDDSAGALFFNKYGYRNGCVPLFKYKNHYFSR